MKILLLVVLMHSFCFSRLKHCLDDNNLGWGKLGLETFSDKNEKISLADLFNSNGRFLKEGPFGKIKEVFFRGERWAIKQMPPPKTKTEISKVDWELDMWEYLCEFESKGKVYPKDHCKASYVPKYFGCSVSSDSLFILQEALSKHMGSKLMRHTYQNKSPAQRAKIMATIAKRLEEFHDQNVVHGDIKPYTIMPVKPDLHDFKIIDFRIAEVYDKVIQGGSINYMSPERLSGETVAKDYIDVYSLALTFAELESSHEDIFESDLECKRKEKLNVCVDRLVERSEQAFLGKGLDSLRSTILKALSYDFRERFRSMKRFRQAIESEIPKLEELEKTENPNGEKIQNDLIEENDDDLETQIQSQFEENLANFKPLNPEIETKNGEISDLNSLLSKIGQGKKRNDSDNQEGETRFGDNIII